VNASMKLCKEEWEVIASGMEFQTVGAIKASEVFLIVVLQGGKNNLQES